MTSVPPFSQAKLVAVLGSGQVEILRLPTLQLHGGEPHSGCLLFDQFVV